ncbi:ROK family transcriptional regulator [Cohnella fermenti]|nr:ROK family transcriptional regulator [Cohnella fermenti]
MQRSKGNLQFMKEINTAAILNLLHLEGMLSRAEIAAITKLSPTTVSALVEELIASGKVEEVGERPSAGAGRKAIALRINRRGGYVLGLSLSGEWLDSAIVDLYGEIVEQARQRVGPGNEAVSEAALAAVARGMERAKTLGTGELLGIGVSAPGIVDEVGASVIYSTALKLERLPLKEKLASRFPGIPVQLFNDSNAAAFAEYYNGAGVGKSHLLYLYIHEGMGSGLILGGQIFSGYRGGAGEIGHIPVEPHGRECSCGRSGCIETMLSAASIADDARRAAMTSGSRPPETLNEALASYESGGELDALFDRYIAALVQMMTTAVNLVSPEAVILEGWMARSPKFMEKLRAEMQSIPFPVPFGAERLLLSSYGDQGPLYGAAVFMLQQVFKTIG